MGKSRKATPKSASNKNGHADHEAPSTIRRVPIHHAPYSESDA